MNEDCSIPKEEQGAAGKRGLSGLLFVIKITGALAEKGSPLEDVYKTAQEVLQNMATYAVGLTACSIPGKQLNMTSHFQIRPRKRCACFRPVGNVRARGG